MELSPSYKEDILEFVTCMENLCDYLGDKGVKLSLGWKFHIIRFHLSDFIGKQGKSFSMFSEQTSESVHKNINKTLKRYCVSEKNSDHGNKLMKMAATYSSMRV